MSYEQPLKGHVMLDAAPQPQAQPQSARVAHATFKSTLADLRSAENQRHTEELRQQLSDLTARLSKLEPALTTEASSPPAVPVEASAFQGRRWAAQPTARGSSTAGGRTGGPDERSQPARQLR